MAIPTQTDIPLATDIDYTNVDEICGYQQLLCKTFELAGGFDYPYGTNATIRQVQSQGFVWLKKVKSTIDNVLNGSASRELALSGVTMMLNSYDFLYRICNGTPDFEYIRKVRLNIVDLWLKGNKSISQTEVVLGLLNEVERDIRSLDSKYAKFAFTVKEDWINELNVYGHFISVPVAEAYARMRYLLNSNLSAYVESKDLPALKAQWIKNHLLSETQLDALNTCDLWNYINFVLHTGYHIHLSLKEQDKTYVSLLSRIATRADLHPFYRQAIELDLMNYQAA